MVQWLRRCIFNAGDPGSILGQGTRSHMPQGRSKTLCAAAKTRCSQINSVFFKERTADLQAPTESGMSNDNLNVSMTWGHKILKGLC